MFLPITISGIVFSTSEGTGIPAAGLNFKSSFSTALDPVTRDFINSSREDGVRAAKAFRSLLPSFEFTYHCDSRKLLEMESGFASVTSMCRGSLYSGTQELSLINRWRYVGGLSNSDTNVMSVSTRDIWPHDAQLEASTVDNDLGPERQFVKQESVDQTAFNYDWESDISMHAPIEGPSDTVSGSDFDFDFMPVAKKRRASSQLSAPKSKKSKKSKVTKVKVIRDGYDGEEEYAEKKKPKKPLSSRPTAVKKVFKCDECGKKCGSAGDLSRHMESKAHKEPSCRCWCGKVYTRPDPLLRHQKLYGHSEQAPTNHDDGIMLVAQT